MSAFGDKLANLSTALEQGAAVVNEAITLDNGGQTLIVFVGEIIADVLAGGTDVPAALAALQNLNTIISNVKKAKEAVAANPGA